MKPNQQLLKRYLLNQFVFLFWFVNNDANNNSPTSTFKYINRIKHLYDRERASSTESIHSARQPLPTSHLASMFGAQRKKAILSPQSSLRAATAGDELNSLISDQDDSIMSSSMMSHASAPRSNKYIKHLRDTFNLGLVPARVANDSPNSEVCHINF